MTTHKGTAATTVKTGLRAKIKSWLKKIVVRPKRAVHHKKGGHAALPKEFANKLTPEEINHLKVESFTGKIHVVSSHKEVVAAVAALEKDRVLGFDTETKPSFVSGVVHPPALLQLIGSDEAYLFRLKATGLPKELVGLLGNPDIIKAGVAVTRDVKELRTLTELDRKSVV